MTITRCQHIDLGAGILLIWMMIVHALGCAWSMDMREYWDITNVSLLPKEMHAVINSDGKLEMLNPIVVYPWLSFFMPWFFYKSGYFFQKKPFKEQIQKDSRKFLLPFIVWSLIGYMLYLWFSYENGNLTFHSATYTILRNFFLTGKIPINGPLWFLLSLFGVKCIANLILPIRKTKFFHFVNIIIIIIGVAIAYELNQRSPRLMPLWVANCSSGLVFFTFGYWLHEYENNWYTIIPCVVLYFSGFVCGFSVVNMIYNKLLSGIYLMWIPMSLGGIVVFNQCCRLVSKYMSYSSMPFQIVGRNTMPIYVIHALVYGSIYQLLQKDACSCLQPYTFSCIMGGYAIICSLSCIAWNKFSRKMRTLS